MCIGQKQVWYMLRLLSNESYIQLTASEHPEFDQWQWVDYWHPLTEVVYFKKNVYEQALKELQPLVQSRQTKKRRLSYKLPISVGAYA